MNPSFKSGFIALIGRPNAGKSTLLNHLIGQKIAIVSDKPQTTRNKIAGILTHEAYQMIFWDTPGIHQPEDRLGRVMVSTALRTLSEVDLIYYLIDATVPFGPGEAFILKKLAEIKTPVFLLLNKIDRLPKTDLLPLIDFYWSQGKWAELVPLSALKGDNLASLLETTLNYLPVGPSYYPADLVTDQPERIIIAEIVREKILRETREEIPHALAVVVDFMERRTTSYYLGITIYVERASQKAIIIGKKGQMLKKIGTVARQELEGILGERIFLDLWVKVKAAWRKNKASLYDFGYYPQD